MSVCISILWKTSIRKTSLYGFFAHLFTLLSIQSLQHINYASVVFRNLDSCLSIPSNRTVEHPVTPEKVQASTEALGSMLLRFSYLVFICSVADCSSVHFFSGMFVGSVAKIRAWSKSG